MRTERRPTARSRRSRKQIVTPADVVVDLHGGDLDEDLRPYSYWYRGGKAAQDSAGLKLAMAFGLDHVIVSDVDPSAPNAGRSLSGQALSRGKTVLVAEAGRSGIVAPADLTSLIEGSLSVLGELEDAAAPAVARAEARSGSRAPGARIAADSAGVFYAAVRATRASRTGQVLGHLTDFLGRPTGEVRSPDRRTRDIHSRRSVGVAESDARERRPDSSRRRGIGAAGEMDAAAPPSDSIRCFARGGIRMTNTIISFENSHDSSIDANSSANRVLARRISRSRRRRCRRLCVAHGRERLRAIVRREPFGNLEKVADGVWAHDLDAARRRSHDGLERRNHRRAATACSRSKGSTSRPARSGSPGSAAS